MNRPARSQPSGDAPDRALPLKQSQEHWFTVVFRGNIRKFEGNPLHVFTPFGQPWAVSVGDLMDQRDTLFEALEELVWIIDRAGLSNLANGVQLGQISWFVKANDRLEAARAALAKALSAEPANGSVSDQDGQLRDTIKDPPPPKIAEETGG